MFIGHYSVAFAFKTEENRIPLWVLFVAVQLLDYVWATFVLLGIEKLRVVPNFTAGSSLDAYYMPYSHSLVAALGWSVLSVVIYRAGCRAKSSAALLVSLAVLSHWMLDLIAHARDLPIYADNWKLGLGLWNYRVPEFGLEVAMLAAGIGLYLRRNIVSGAHRWSVIGFGLGLVVIQWGDTFVPRSPLTANATAIGVLVFYTLFVRVSFLVERRR